MRIKRLIGEDIVIGNTSYYYVYFICDRVGHIKIGITNCIRLRIDSLQTANAMKLFLVGYFKVSDEYAAKDLEKLLHHRFSYARLQGEWFKQKPILRWIQNNNIEDLIVVAKINGDKVYE